MMQDKIDHVSQYFKTNIMRVLNHLNSDYIVAITGSFSYQFSDNSSDIDVVVIGNFPNDTFQNEHRNLLFTHVLIDNTPVHFIPCLAETLTYKILFAEDCGISIRQCDDIPALFSITNMIPLYDEKSRIRKVKNTIRDIGEEYWSELVIEKCCKQIDVMEAFYSHCRRNDDYPNLVLTGSALKGLLEIIHLANRQYYPNEKWLLRNCKESLPVFFDNLVNKQDSLIKSRFSSDAAVPVMRSLTHQIIDVLNEKTNVPEYVCRDLLDP